MAIPMKPNLPGIDNEGIENFISGGSVSRSNGSKKESSINKNDEIRPYLLMLPKELHKEIKLKAFQKGITIKEYIIEALKEKKD